MKDVTPLNVIPWDGFKISKPGIYSGVPITTYHRDLCVGPSVSSGGLRKIETKNAEKYFDGSYLNPDAEPEGPKEAYVFGRAVHTLFMGETGFREDFVIRPTTYPTDPSKPWNGNSKDCQKWLAEAALAGKQVLKEDQLKTIQGMATKLGAHPTVKAGILRGLVEHSIVWPVQVPVKLSETETVMVTVYLKSRPDNLPTDGNMIVDYKTAEDASPEGARRAITEHGYHQQMALAVWGLRAVTGREITDVILLFQEKSRPFSINHKPLLAEAINRGHQQNLRSLLKFARGVHTGEWAGYDDDEVPAGLSPWLENRLKLEDEHGYLPPMEFPAMALATPDDSEAV